ncbi:MAG: DHHA1 domain-containing protein [Candidatus Helarchaeota archaeon]
MIICHNDPDGFASAGILLLTGRDKLEDLRYSTVRYINKFLKKLLREEDIQNLYILDLNADDSKTYVQSLIALRQKGYSITLLDHHQIVENFDFELREEGIEVIRDTKISCSELIFNHYITEIQDRRKAEFLLCIGAIGDRLITPHVQKVINSFRREEIFDVYACLLAGIQNGKEFLYSIFEEKDRDGVGFTKKLYYRAARKRFRIEKIKAKINVLKESIGSISIVHIFKPYIGFAAGYLIDLDDIDFAIAIGDGPPDFKNWFYLNMQKFLNFIFRKNGRPKQSKVRISFRAKIPINTIISRLAQKHNGFGGGHKFACGATIPQENLILFLKEVIRELKKL